MAIKSYNQLKFLNLVTMAKKKKSIIAILMLTNKVVIKILFFGKLFRTNVISLEIKLYKQLKLLNSITMATTKLV